MINRRNDFPHGGSEIILYQTEDGRNRVEVRLEEETVWLTQQLMAELFQTTKQNVGQHLKNIFASGELRPDSVVKKTFTTAADGKEYATLLYNLDAIISVGYRITVMFLDQAEFRAQRRQDIHMSDWTGFLDKFLRDTELPVLAGAGSVSHEGAMAWANEQYDAFVERRRLEAEAVAEERYLEDLRSSAKTLESTRKKPPSRVKTPKTRKKE